MKELRIQLTDEQAAEYADWTEVAAFRIRDLGDGTAEIMDAAEAQDVYSRAAGAPDRWVRLALPASLLDELAGEVS